MTTTSYYLTDRGNLYRSHDTEFRPVRRSGSSRPKALPAPDSSRRAEYGKKQIVADVMGAVAITALCATYWLHMWLL